MKKHKTFGPAHLQILVNTLLLFKGINIMSLTHEYLLDLYTFIICKEGFEIIGLCGVELNHAKKKLKKERLM